MFEMLTETPSLAYYRSLPQNVIMNLLGLPHTSSARAFKKGDLAVDLQDRASDYWLVMVPAQRADGTTRQG